MKNWDPIVDKRIILKAGHPGMLRHGHSWVYRNQILSVEGPVEPGVLVDVCTEKKRFLGRGYYNPKSEISVRLLTRHDEPIDKDFFVRKINRSVDWRRRYVRDTNAMRLVSSEADGLPGLIVDQYAEVLVAQFLTLGMDTLRPMILEALAESLPSSRGLYEKSDSHSRTLEGLAERSGWIEKNCGDEVVIVERDLQFALPLGLGHKTGFYLDQRENRFFLRELGLKGRVLDAFCYEGAFALHLASGGAQVLAIDIQKEAIARANEHRERNSIPSERVEFKVANVFDELKEFEKAQERFDLVILDPPSFVKRKAGLEGAVSGYKEILLRSMKLLNDGGLLAVFSCSYHFGDDLLMQVCLRAAADVKKELRLVKFFKQASDHPVDPFIPETYYLKGFLLSVLSV